MNKYMNKNISLGLLLLIAAMVVVPASAFPTRESACEGCHAAPPNSMSISTDIISKTVSQGDSFNVVVTWGGGDPTANTAVKWPTNVLDNAMFTPAPPLLYPVPTISGSQSFTLTVPATAPLGLHTVRVYVANGPKFETAYQDIAVTVTAPPPPPPPPADTTAPVITILGANPVDVTQGSVYNDAGAAALDAVDGVVAVTTVSTVNTAVIGTYTVTYTAADAAGNTATAVRMVNVVVTPSPPPTTPPDDDDHEDDGHHGDDGHGETDEE